MTQKHDDSKKQAMTGFTVKTGINAGAWVKGKKPTQKSKTRVSYQLDNALQKLSAKD